MWPALAETEQTVLGRFNIDDIAKRASAQTSFLPCLAAVHGLDSFGSIPLGGKVN
jgi:hypothetical protein